MIVLYILGYLCRNKQNSCAALNAHFSHKTVIKTANKYNLKTILIGSEMVDLGLVFKVSLYSSWVYRWRPGC